MTARILLINPKYAHNVGSAVRAASCFGGDMVLYTGDRVSLAGRLPREERMKDYAATEWRQLLGPRPVDAASLGGYTPVAVELVENSENLLQFHHPERALYVFGPEDGSLPKGIRLNCHQFVTIPTFHCVNLAAAVYITLYDRTAKRVAAGLEEPPSVAGESRGVWHTPACEALS